MFDIVQTPLLPVDQEYDLTLRNDLNTNGNIQWYYFRTSITQSQAEQAATAKTPTNTTNTTDQSTSLFPLRVRFNIINMQKSDALYNYGMKPAVYSVQQQEKDWRHRGEDICYYKNTCTSAMDLDEPVRSKRILESVYVLTFTYTFESPDEVYFAHTFPYTYTDLKKSLARLEEDSRIASIMHRKVSTQHTSPSPPLLSLASPLYYVHSYVYRTSHDIPTPLPPPQSTVYTTTTSFYLVIDR